MVLRIEMIQKYTATPRYYRPMREGEDPFTVVSDAFKTGFIEVPSGHTNTPERVFLPTATVKSIHVQPDEAGLYAQTKV